MSRNSDRKASFELAIEDYDEKALDKCVNFAEHRFISIERDPQTGATYVKGHKTMRGACGHLGRVVEGVEGYTPESVLDLDTGELHELDVFAFVAPRSVDAVALMLPRELAEAVVGVLRQTGSEAPHDQAAAIRLIEKAIERRH